MKSGTSLWSPYNSTLYSAAFNVPPGKVVLLFADGLKLWKVRASSEESRVPQTVCIRKLIHGYDANPVNYLPCGFVFDISQVTADTIVDAIVRTCGAPWQLTSCRNLGIIGVPGTYRLELNDSTAIGEAQVYAYQYDADSIPVHVADKFF